MTTIAYRNGVMAADSGHYDNGTITSGRIKLARDQAGTLYGATGIAADCSAFIEAVEGADPKKAAEWPVPREMIHDADLHTTFTVLVAHSSGRLELLTHGKRTNLGNLGYYAIGGGDVAALGAMFAGANAVSGVEAACEHTQYAKGPILSIDHQGRRCIHHPQPNDAFTPSGWEQRYAGGFEQFKETLNDVANRGAGRVKTSGDIPLDRDDMLIDWHHALYPLSARLTKRALEFMQYDETTGKLITTRQKLERLMETAGAI